MDYASGPQPHPISLEFSIKLHPEFMASLRTLGVDVSERTVSRLLGMQLRPSSQTWKTFLTNHLASAASMDFFTVPTLTGRVLFVLIVLAHHRRPPIDQVRAIGLPTSENRSASAVTYPVRCGQADTLQRPAVGRS